MNQSTSTWPMDAAGQSSPVSLSTGLSLAGLGVLETLGFRALRHNLKSWKGVGLRLRMPQGHTILLGDCEAKTSVELHVADSAFFRRILTGADLGFAESYMDGEWDSSDLVALLSAFALQSARLVVPKISIPNRAFSWLMHKWRSNTLAGSKRNIQSHYDLGNAFYGKWLDSTMQYSSAVYPLADATLEQAQDAKLRLLIAKLDPQPGMRILEIGSGWGELGIRLARDHGCHVTTLTLSKEQHALVNSRIAKEKVEDRMQVLLQDYRETQGLYDRVVSIEMIEAVGHENLGTYFAQIDRLLAPNGHAVVQAITMPEERYAHYLRKPDFIQKHIFPGAVCPSLQAMVNAMAKDSRLLVQHMENLGPHYARTLRDWAVRFEDAWDQIAPLGFDAKFQRMWRYYLGYCEAGFATRRLGLQQLVLTRMCNTDMPEQPVTVKEVML